MKQPWKALMAIVLAIGSLAGPSRASEPSMQFSILDTAELINNSTGEFSTLLAAVRAAGLGSALMDDGLTVFAPTDAAFAAIGLNADNLRQVISQEDLTAVLTYHVAATVVSPADLERGRDVATLNGEIVVSKRKGIIYLNRRGNRPATIIMDPVYATNGVIYVIDAVLDPADAPAAGGGGDAGGGGGSEEPGDKPKKKKKKKKDRPKKDPPKDNPPKDDPPKDDPPKHDPPSKPELPKKPRVPIKQPREKDFKDHDDYEDALEDYHDYLEDFHEDWEEVLEEYYEHDYEDFYEELHEFYEEYHIPVR